MCGPMVTSLIQYMLFLLLQSFCIVPHAFFFVLNDMVHLDFQYFEFLIGAKSIYVGNGHVFADF